MTVTNVDKRPETLTMTISAEFDAPVERVWEMWENPRLLERWWGPPTYPATVVEHDLTPGGMVEYYMTGPEGDRHGGWWRVRAVDAPHSLDFEDGFADEKGDFNADMPVVNVHVAVRSKAGGGTVMTIETKFPSADAMERLIAMGIEEGMAAALGQIDDLLAHEPNVI